MIYLQTHLNPLHGSWFIHRISNHSVILSTLFDIIRAFRKHKYVKPNRTNNDHPLDRASSQQDSAVHSRELYLHLYL